MNKKTVLVTAIGGDIGNSYARFVCGEEFSLIGCDMNQLLCQNADIERFFQVPPASQPHEYLDAIKDIVEKSNVDLIVPISEPEIKTFHDNRGIWSSWKERVLINNELILDNFLDKYKTVKYLESIGFKTPKTYFLKDYQNQLSFPMIIKPINSCGSKDIWKIKSDLDIDYFKQKDDGIYLIQEYLGGDDQEYTTGIFSDGKDIASITFKRKLGPGGTSAEVILMDSEIMDDMVQKLACKINLVGSINIQTRLCNGEFIPFEINPRFSSTLGFRKQFGFSDCLWWPRICLGGEYTYRRQCKSGKGVRYFTECYVEMDRI
ncbi:MAG: ATP-grasp domain-containing protein [Candidatus Omnitrophica bacterium]|nr:ATP-grasp domain-containing protein [Candidatus Omnitrophota bacterium]